jgi:hypothetical protein
MNFIKDQIVVVSNKKHSSSGRLGRVIIHFTKGKFAGRVLVHFNKYNLTFFEWEIEDISSYNKRMRTNQVEIPNPIVHPAIYKDLD